VIRCHVLDPKLLQLFVFIADERHFGRAAERAGLAQSSASVQMRRLEDIIGAPFLSATGARRFNSPRSDAIS